MYLTKKGQIAIFVIVAIVIVGFLVVLLVYPRIQPYIGGEVNPSAYMKQCVGQDVDKVLAVLREQGGYYSPDNYVLYKGEKIQYLCYTAENYKPCIVQQPLLVRHVELELKSKIEPKARQCMQQLVSIYERRGYDVKSNAGELNVIIIPSNIKIEFNSPLELRKEGTQVFRKFGYSKDSELYDLLLTATSIVQFESTLGDSETSLYLQFYPDLKIEKIKRDADTIYILSNVVSNDKFVFATRSLVWPQGYGLS